MSKKQTSDLKIVEDMLNRANMDFESDDQSVKTPTVVFLFDEDGHLVDALSSQAFDLYHDEDEAYVGEEDEEEEDEIDILDYYNEDED